MGAARAEGTPRLTRNHVPGELLVTFDPSMRRILVYLALGLLTMVSPSLAQEASPASWVP